MDIKLDLVIVLAHGLLAVASFVIMWILDLVWEEPTEFEETPGLHWELIDMEWAKW